MIRDPRLVKIRVIRGRRYNLGNHDFKCIAALRMDFAERNADAHGESHLNLCNGRRWRGKTEDREPFARAISAIAALRASK
jgi:hypothetical protein